MTILVVAAHPDDEVLGCGGTMARHSAEGEDVIVVIMAQGATSRSSTGVNTGAMTEEISALQEAAVRANGLLGVKDVKFFDFPDNRLDEIALLDLIKACEAVVRDVDPRMVYTHHPSDLNVDHRMVSQAVATTCRPLPGSSLRALNFFEVPSSTEWQTPQSAHPFVPNLFVDITDTLALKSQALEVYEMEMREFPHPRSLPAVDHLAHWRGASAGVGAAEAFVIAREIRAAP